MFSCLESVFFVALRRLCRCVFCAVNLLCGSGDRDGAIHLNGLQCYNLESRTLFGHLDVAMLRNDGSGLVEGSGWGESVVWVREGHCVSLALMLLRNRISSR